MEPDLKRQMVVVRSKSLSPRVKGINFNADGECTNFQELCPKGGGPGFDIVVIEQLADHRQGPRPAVHLDMRLHVAFGQVGHRRFRRRRRRERILAAADAVDHLRRRAARRLRGHLGVAADRDASQAAGRPSCLDHIDLASGGIACSEYLARGNTSCSTPGPVLHPPIGPARSVTNLTATSALGACTQTHAFPWRITHSGQFEFNRIAADPSSTRVRRVPPSVPFARRSLAYDPVPVTIAHVPVRGVRPVDGCDPVPARLLARDPAVSVVVVASEHVVPTSAPSGISCRCRRRPAHHGVHRGARAALKDPFERRGLSPIHGEPVGALHLEHPPGEPAPVPARDPFTGVVAALLPAVHLRGGEREVAKVLGELLSCGPIHGAESRVVCLARRDDVLDVGLSGGGEARPRVGTVDRPELPDDVLLHRLRIGVVPLPLVGRTAVLGRHGEAAPGLGGCGAGEREGGEHDREGKDPRRAPPRAALC